jgi:predicted GIY-YIG superfamily endonuclease
MTADDEKIARSIAYEAANVVADKAIEHIKATTLVALSAVQRETDALRREHELKMEAMRNEREMKIAAQSQKCGSDIAAHAAACPMRKDLADTKVVMDAIVNKGLGIYLAVGFFASMIGAALVFFGPTILRRVCP